MDICEPNLPMERGITANPRTTTTGALYNVSAIVLPDVAEVFGLAPGTRDEVFSSKRQNK